MENKTREKIIIELNVDSNLGGEVFLTHPDLVGRLLLRSSSPRMAEVQLEALEVPTVSPEVQSRFETTQELMGTLRELSQIGPELLQEIFGRKTQGTEGK